MDRRLLVLHLVALFSLVGNRVAGTSYAAGQGAADNGHTAKKNPMDYSRYAQDAHEISGHNGLRGSLASNTCEGQYDVKNSTIIRTKDSINNGADFVGDMIVDEAVECRWRCCQKEGKCDTAVFVEDKSKDKNCFLFKCWDEKILKCQFSSHWGYVTAIIGGFVDALPTRQVESADDSGRDEEFIHNGEDLQSENVDSSDKLEGDRDDITECRRGQIQCASGECIVARYVCNGIDDCADGSDEMGCKYGNWKHWDEYNHRGDTYLPGSQDGYDDNDRGDDDTVGYRPDDTNEEGDVREDTGGDGKADGLVEHGSNTNDDKDSETGGGEEENEVATESKEPVDSPTLPSVSTVQPQQPTVPESEIPHKDEDQSPPDITPKVDNNDQPDHDSDHKVEPFGSHPATSAILPLAVGLIITLLLLMMLSCRLRYMNRRLRYGRLKTHAHDADYLINGMYL